MDTLNISISPLVSCPCPHHPLHITLPISMSPVPSSCLLHLLPVPSTCATTMSWSPPRSSAVLDFVFSLPAPLTISWSLQPSDPLPTTVPMSLQSSPGDIGHLSVTSTVCCHLDHLLQGTTPIPMTPPPYPCPLHVSNSLFGSHLIPVPTVISMSTLLSPPPGSGHLDLLPVSPLLGPSVPLSLPSSSSPLSPTFCRPSAPAPPTGTPLALSPPHP